MSPILEDNAKDLFDNPFIPYTPVPFIEGEIDVNLASNETDQGKLAWKIAKWQQQLSKSDETKTPFVWPPMVEGHVKPAHRLTYSMTDELLEGRNTQSDYDSYNTTGSGSTPATTLSHRTTVPPSKYPPLSRCSLRSTSSPLPPPVQTCSVEDGDGDYMLTSALKKRKAKEKPASKKVVFETRALLKNRKDLFATHSKTVETPTASHVAADMNEESKAPPTSTNTWIHCSFNHCSHKCRALGDMQRHLQSAKHRKPSIPCPRHCGHTFTRVDAAKRHAKSKRCKAEVESLV